MKNMKKTTIGLLLAGTMLATPAVAQQQGGQQQNQQSYNQLVDQYATAALAFYVEQRCQQLDDGAYQDYAENLQLVSNFMFVLMGKDDNDKLLRTMKAIGDDAKTNPCDGDTFKFSLAGYQVASTMATRVRLLGDEELNQLNALFQEDQAIRETQDAIEAEEGSGAGATTGNTNPPANTAATPAPQPEPEPIQRNNEPAIALLPQTEITRQDVPERSNQSSTADTGTSNPTPPPATTAQTSTQTASAAQPAGILLANYVNPFPYSPAAAPAGETEKDMKRRHRQELIDLRRAQREELDAFKDNRDSYANSDAVKDFIEDRQDNEFDAMRNRHRAELSRF